MPEARINLDLPPQHRWTAFIRATIQRHGFENSIGRSLAFFDDLRRQSGCDRMCIAELALRFTSNYRSQWYELKGISEELARSMNNPPSAETLAAFQYMYELSHVNNSELRLGGTSLLVATSEGRVLHGRNFDYPREVLNSTVQITWTRNKHPLFTSIMTFPIVGVLTGVRAEEFSLSVTWRKGITDFMATMKCLKDSRFSPTLNAVREMFEMGSSTRALYPLIADRLHMSRLCVPAFFAVGGPKASQGVIITRTPELSLKPWELSPDGSVWFAAITNYDYWTHQPEEDDRLGQVIRHLTDLGPERGASSEGVLETLKLLGDGKTRGVFNDMTVYTAIMTPLDGSVQSILWT